MPGWPNRHISYYKTTGLIKATLELQHLDSNVDRPAIVVCLLSVVKDCSKQPKILYCLFFSCFQCSSHLARVKYTRSFRGDNCMRVDASIYCHRSVLDAHALTDRSAWSGIPFENVCMNCTEAAKEWCWRLAQAFRPISNCKPAILFTTQKTFFWMLWSRKVFV